jgi:hypothetical protein
MTIEDNHFSWATCHLEILLEKPEASFEAQSEAMLLPTQR